MNRHGIDLHATAKKRLCTFLYASIFILGLILTILALRISLSFYLEYVSLDDFLTLDRERLIQSYRLTVFSIGLVFILLSYVLRRKRAIETLLKDKSLSAKNVILNTTLVFISVFIGLGMLEVGLRVLGHGKFNVEVPHPERAIFWHYDSLLGWKHLPNQEGRFALSDIDVSVKINGKGLRDKLYSYQRQGPVFRIVVLGDSFTWGFGVAQEQVFTEVMEQSRENLEVINMGVSGYSTDQEYLFLREEGLKYQPQLILLMFFEDDVYHNSLTINFLIYPKPKYSIVDGQLVLTHRPSPKVSVFRKVNYFLRTHLIVYNHLARVFLYNPAEPIRLTREFASGIMLWLTGREKEDPYELTFAIIDEMRDLIYETDAQIVVVEISTHDQAMLFDSTKQSKLAEYCQVANIPFLDLAGPFHEYLQSNREQSLQFPGDRHWNGEAHKVAAEVILSYLRADGLIPTN